MRKSLLALILVGSLLAVAVTTVLAGNPAADRIPDVGDIDVPANSAASTNADTDAAVLTDSAPAPGAADGLGTAKASGDHLAVAPPSAADDGLATADLAMTDGGVSVPPLAATDGLATAEATEATDLTDNPAADSIPTVGSIPVPAADEAVDNPPSAVPSGEAASGLFVAAAAGLP